MGRYFQSTSTDFIDDAMYQNPVDLMASALEAKDKEFNSAIEGAESALDFELNPHSKDSEEANRIRSQYEEQVTSITDEAYKDKLNAGQLQQKIRGLQRDMITSKKEGDIYNINQRNSDIIKTKQGLIEDYRKNPEDYAAFKSAGEIGAYVDSKYSGYKDEDGMYSTSPQAALQSKDQDIDILKNLFTEHTGMDYHGKSDKDLGLMMQTTEFKDKGLSGEELQTTIKEFLKSDKGLQNFFAQQAEVKTMRGIETDADTELANYANDLYSLGNELYQERRVMNKVTNSSLPKGLQDKLDEDKNNPITVKRVTSVKVNELSNIINQDSESDVPIASGIPFVSDPAYGRVDNYITTQVNEFESGVTENLSKILEKGAMQGVSIDFSSGSIVPTGDISEVSDVFKDENGLLKSLEDVVLETYTNTYGDTDKDVDQFKTFKKGLAANNVLKDFKNSFNSMFSEGVDLSQFSGEGMVSESGLFFTDSDNPEKIKKTIVEGLNNEATRGSAEIYVNDLQAKFSGKSGKKIVFKNPGESFEELAKRLGIDNGTVEGSMGPSVANPSQRAIESQYELVEIDSPTGKIKLNALKSKLDLVSNTTINQNQKDKTGTIDGTPLNTNNVTVLETDTELAESEFSFSEDVFFKSGYVEEGNDVPVLTTMSYGGQSFDVTIDAMTTGLPKETYDKIQKKREDSYIPNLLDSMSAKNQAIKSRPNKSPILTTLRIPKADRRSIMMGEDEIMIYTNNEGVLMMESEGVAKEVESVNSVYQTLNFLYQQ